MKSGQAHDHVTFTVDKMPTGAGERVYASAAHDCGQAAGKIDLTGCLCPQKSKDTAISTFGALDPTHAVLGPTVDGGYYLLGLKENRASLTEDIPWGTGPVFEKTLNILKIQTLSYISLDAFFDVDTLEEFRQARHLRPLKHLGIR